MEEKRFDIIMPYNHRTAMLIDTWNELASLPLNFALADLSDEEMKMIKEWVDFLNSKYPTPSRQTKLIGD